MPDTTTTKPTKAAIYARVSTSDKGQDVETQLVPLRRLVEAREWEATEYVDEGVSGSQSRREGLGRMMSDVRAARVDVVVVHRFDRFARSTSHLLRALEEFRERGVEFLSLSENVDTSTPVGKMTFVLVSAISEFELSLTKARVQAGLDRARAQGKTLGRPRKAVSLTPALLMLREGADLTTTAKAVGVSRTTLRRRLTEAGEWPLLGAVQNPPQAPVP